MGRGICHCLCGVVVWGLLAHVAWASETVLYVDAAAAGAGSGASWTDAYHDLQDALTATAGVSGPIEIRVAQGVYRPHGVADEMEEELGVTFFVVGEIALVGGYAGLAGDDPDVRDVTRYQTTLSGDLVGDDLPGDAWDWPSRTDNCWQVVTVAEAEATVVLDGLTVTGGTRCGVLIDPGDARLTACRFVENGSGGVNGWTGDVVLTDCLFERNGHNTMSDGGLDGSGAMQLTDCAFIENNGGAISGGNPLSLLRCSFIGNTGRIGAAAIDSHGDLTARQCLFQGNQSFPGGTVRSWKGTARLTGCTFTGNISGHRGAVDALGGALILTDCLFSGNSSRRGAGAVTTIGDLVRVDGCLFVGNSCESGAGAVANQGTTIMRLSNCTFTGNRGRPTAVEHAPIPGSIAEMNQCIVWNGPDPFTRFAAFPPTIVTTYCDIEGGYAGQGNIDVDPCFVDPGHWDANGTPDDTSDDVWVVGDYHLRSQAGHWDRETEDWVLDEVTSPCLDVGDPNGPLGFEPFPNGGFINLGTYGGSNEASRSYFGAPVCVQIAGDINGDGIVNERDRDIMMSHWLMEAPKSDNMPPSIALLSPAPGDTFTAGTPMVLRAETSDPDGTVIRVKYTLTSRSETTVYVTGVSGTDPTDNWRVSWEDWACVTIRFGQTYTIQAEAMDDHGAKTTTPEVEINLSL